MTLAGALSGSSLLTKTGSGLIAITGTGSLSGATTVTEGTLKVNGSIASSGVIVQAGASSPAVAPWERSRSSPAARSLLRAGRRLDALPPEPLNHRGIVRPAINRCSGFRRFATLHFKREAVVRRAVSVAGPHRFRPFAERT